MKSLNVVQVLGNLGAAPELKYTSSGKAVAKFNVAVNEQWENEKGKQERTTWIPVVAWEKLAELMAKVLHKGSRVLISGKWSLQKWEDQNQVKKEKAFITARDVIFLDAPKEQQQPSSTDGPITDDDIPF